MATFARVGRNGLAGHLQQALRFMSTKNAGTGGANKILPTEAIKGPAEPIRRGLPTSLTSMSDPVYDYMSQNYERPPVRGRPGTVIGGASQVPRAGYQHSLMDPSVDDFFQIPYERPGRRR